MLFDVLGMPGTEFWIREHYLHVCLGRLKEILCFFCMTVRRQAACEPHMPLDMRPKTGDTKDLVTLERLLDYSLPKDCGR